MFVDLVNMGNDNCYILCISLLGLNTDHIRFDMFIKNIFHIHIADVKTVLY